MDVSKLAAEFPRNAVHWRAQNLTRNKDKALALAYLDARDVMDRLDEVCGPENWQSEYVETARGRVICRIGIYSDEHGGWIWKSDGAGDTAVEGEKGGISDAFKRAAVHWGIGRYLYRLDAVWCPCKVNDKTGKWKEWSADPWDFVRGGNHKPKAPSQPPKKPENPAQKFAKEIISKLEGCKTLEAFEAATNSTEYRADLAELRSISAPAAEWVAGKVAERNSKLEADKYT